MQLKLIKTELNRSGAISVLKNQTTKVIGSVNCEYLNTEPIESSPPYSITMILGFIVNLGLEYIFVYSF